MTTSFEVNQKCTGVDSPLHSFTKLAMQKVCICYMASFSCNIIRTIQSPTCNIMCIHNNYVIKNDFDILQPQQNPQVESVMNIYISKVDIGH